jgi:hypothetical protein
LQIFKLKMAKIENVEKIKERIAKWNTNKYRVRREHSLASHISL